jgi:hypothetical protein
MNTPGLVGAAGRATRKGLPWLSLLAISASVAYAITVAAAGEPSAGDAQTTMGAGGAQACDTTGGRLLYVGLNSWIPAETGPRCPDGIP